jgi:hypothetical protein
MALLCGYCPTRRVLRYLTLWPNRSPEFTGPPVVLPYDRNRPSVAARGTVKVPATGGPIRVRCRLGHSWTLTQEELVPAFTDAVAAGRRDLAAGVDLARDPRGRAHGLPRPLG